MTRYLIGYAIAALATCLLVLALGVWKAWRQRQRERKG